MIFTLCCLLPVSTAVIDIINAPRKTNSWMLLIAKKTPNVKPTTRSKNCFAVSGGFWDGVGFVILFSRKSAKG